MANTVNRPSQSNMEWINVKDRKTGKVTRCRNTAYWKDTYNKLKDDRKTSADSILGNEKTEGIGYGLDNVTDRKMLEVIKAGGLGDAKAAWESNQIQVDECLEDSFGGNGFQPSVYDLKNRLEKSDDILKDVSEDIIDSMARRYEYDGLGTVSEAEKKLYAEELVVSGFFKGTKLGKAVEITDSMVDRKALRDYAKDHGYGSSRTPEHDYMGSAATAGSKSGLYGADLATEVKSGLKDLRSKGILKGRVSFKNGSYSRYITIKSPGFNDLSRAERSFITSRVNNSLQPFTLAFDHNRSNSMVDYFDSARTEVRISE